MTPRKAVKLAKLTPLEEKYWEQCFEYWVNEGKSDLNADKKAWEDMKKEFPRLRGFDGAKP